MLCQEKPTRGVDLATFQAYDNVFGVTAHSFIGEDWRSMHAFGRKLFAFLAAVLLLFATYYAIFSEDPPAADFTFINGTEIESIDPAIVTGQPEGRIIRSLFEGLVNWAPDDLRSIPGVAKKWTTSEDGRTVTFFLRDNARWSDGSPVTAGDFVYSYRRFLDPLTAAEYSYQMYYVTGAEKYNRGEVEIGDTVEVELHDPPEGAYEFARGELVRGILVKKDQVVLGDRLDEKDTARRTVRLYAVEVNGKLRRFKVGKEEYRELKKFDDHETAQQVLIEFSNVGVKAVDDRTLVFTLKSKVPYFVSLTGFYPLYPVHGESIDRLGYPAWTRPENLVCNGAFTLGSRKVRDRIRLVKSETYWDADNVKLNTIDALAVESAITGLNMYENRQVDWMTTVPTAIVPEMIKQKRPDFHATEYLTIAFYRFNVTRKPLDDPRVRHALTLAIDREQIVKKILRAGQVAATSYVPPGIEGYDAPTCCQYDPEEARRLLKEAGFPGGKGFPELTLLYNTSEDLKKIAEVIQYQWHDALGVRIKLQSQEWSTFQSRVHGMDYDIARAGWIGDYMDPNTFLDMFVSQGGNNETGWSNDEYDDLIKNRVLAEDDRERRMALLRKAEEILLSEMPVLPLYYGVSTLMVRPYVKGFHDNILDVHPLKDISVDQVEKARDQERRGER